MGATAALGHREHPAALQRKSLPRDSRVQVPSRLRCVMLPTAALGRAQRFRKCHGGGGTVMWLLQRRHGSSGSKEGELLLSGDGGVCVGHAMLQGERSRAPMVSSVRRPPKGCTAVARLPGTEASRAPGHAHAELPARPATRAVAPGAH